MSKKLDSLLEKERRLKAQIQQAKAAERTLERKRETRRKVLAGAAVLAKVEAGLWPQEDFLAMMDSFLSRASERELFGLDGGSEADGNKTTQPPATPSNQPVPLTQDLKLVKPLPETDDEIQLAY